MSADCPKCLNGCGGARSDCPQNAPPAPPPPPEPKRKPGRPKRAIVIEPDAPPEIERFREEARLGIVRQAPIHHRSSYKKEFDRTAASMAKLGATEIEIADGLGVSLSAVRNWLATYPSFEQAVRLGKEVADGRVERSLYSKAIGYEYDTVKIFLARNGEPVEVPYREHIPPDTTACIFWLKNRKREEWRDKPVEEADKETTIRVVGGLPPEDA